MLMLGTPAQPAAAPDSFFYPGGGGIVAWRQWQAQNVAHGYINGKLPSVLMQRGHRVGKYGKTPDLYSVALPMDGWYRETVAVINASHQLPAVKAQLIAAATGRLQTLQKQWSQSGQSVFQQVASVATPIINNPLFNPVGVGIATATGVSATTQLEIGAAVGAAAVAAGMASGGAAVTPAAAGDAGAVADVGTVSDIGTLTDLGTASDVGAVAGDAGLAAGADAGASASTIGVLGINTGITSGSAALDGLAGVAATTAASNALAPHPPAPQRRQAAPSGAAPSSGGKIAAAGLGVGALLLLLL